MVSKLAKSNAAVRVGGAGGEQGRVKGDWGDGSVVGRSRGRGRTNEFMS